MEIHNPCSLPLVFVLNSSVVIDGRIYVLMAKDVSHQADIAGLSVEGGAVGAAKLMRRDLFVGDHHTGIFPDKALYGVDANAFALKGIEECLFVSRDRRNKLALGMNIVIKSVMDIITKIKNVLATSFSNYVERIYNKVYIR